MYLELTDLAIQKRHAGIMVDAIKFHKLLTLGCLVLVGALAGCQVGLKNQSPPALGDYRIIGYVNTGTDVREIDPYKLTHINFSFARLDSTGTLYFRSPGS